MAGNGYFSPPPPYTPYSPSVASASQQPQQLQQSGPPSSSGGYIAYSQPPTSSPVTPAYLSSPYSIPYSMPHDSTTSATQNPPLPNAQELPVESKPQPVYYQPPPNAPPTPAFTPSHSQTGLNSQVPGGPSTQYFPPPAQTPPSHQQEPVVNAQSGYYQPPSNAPPTPAYTPSPYGQPGLYSQAPSAPPTQYVPPPPPQSTAGQLRTGAQASYYQPLANALPAQDTNPSLANPVQTPQNGYPVETQQHQSQNGYPLETQQSQSQPPPTPAQSQNGYPLETQQPQSQPPPTPAQSQIRYPLETQQYQAPQAPALAQNGYPLEMQQHQSQSLPAPAQSPQNAYPVEKQDYQPQPPPALPQFQTGYTPEQQPYQSQPLPAPTQSQNSYLLEKPQYQSLPPPPPAQSFTNGYSSEKDQCQSQPPPPPFLQPSTNVQSTYNPSIVYGQSAPIFSQPPIPQPYSPTPQPFQNVYLPEKQEYQQYPPQLGHPQTQYLPLGQPQNLNDPLAMGTLAAALPSFPAPVRPGPTPLPAKDDQKSSKTKRFFGDTLVGRAARSSVSTVTSTVKLPACLSPWGDNNPVTLPNVRYRDAVLFATFHVVGGPLVDGASNLVTDAFGADTFVAEIVSSGAGFINGNTIVKYGVFQIVEQAIDKGVIEHILPEVEKTIRTTSVKSMQVAIKHKLMGVDADIRFIKPYPTTSATACDKGWFCPYLYASSRTPVIPRSQDFEMAQCFNPYLAADTALTHKLLAELPCIIPLCDPDPTHHLPHARLLVLFTGITPFRAGMWSTSRRPGCAQLIFHLLNGCPALVLPVCASQTPIVSWSPWTLDQMQNFGASGYQAATQHRQVTECLLQLVERQALYPCVRDVAGAFERVMGRVVTMIINGALAAPKAVEGKVFAKLDVERAGIVMFRY